MAYTFSYDYVEAVTAFLNGDELNEDEQSTLLDLAEAITTAAKAGWPDPFTDTEPSEDDDDADHH